VLARLPLAGDLIASHWTALAHNADRTAALLRQLLV
jgi:hypothetical protein